MDYEVGGLVHHQQILVLEDYRDVDVLGLQLRIGQSDIDFLAGTGLVGWIGGLAIHEHGA
jgi:hypothetical protein